MTAIKEETLRCLYCVEHEQFRLMTAHARASWYLCSRCGHIAMPGYPNFKCGCANCIDGQIPEYLAEASQPEVF